MADELNVDDLLKHNIETVDSPALPVPVELPPLDAPSVVTPAHASVSPDEPVDDILAKLLSRISPVAEATPYRKMIWYGPPGTWKTVTACTAPRPLLVAIEPNGPLSLRNHPEIEAKTQVFEFRGFVQLETLIRKMTEKPEAFPFDTVIIDTVNELQKYDLDVFIAKAHAEDSARSEFKATWDEYGASTEHMRRFVGELERMPFNVIMLCHARATEDKTRGIITQGPDLTQKLAGTIVGKMDLVGYMDIGYEDGVPYSTMTVHKTDRITAKTRIGGLPQVIKNPTWDKITNTITQK